MKSSTSKLSAVFMAAILCTVFIAAIVFSSGNMAVAGDEHGPKHKVNEAGLTYGTSLYATSDEEMPDLVAVIASNGEDGYYYWKDYLSLTEKDFLYTEEELDIRVPKKERAVAEAFKDQLDSYYGFELLSTDDVVECLKTTIEPLTNEEQEILIKSSEEKTNLLNSIRSQSGGSKNTVEALSSKSTSNENQVDDLTKTIDIFNKKLEKAVSKNQTIRGEAISKTRAVDSVTQISKQVDKNVQELNSSAVMTEIELEDGSTAKVMMDAFPALEIKSGSKLMSEQLFVAAYNRAMDSVGTPIPVYESDGKTVIGEYIVDTL